MEMSIQAELADVMSKVNAWSLAKETELQAVKAEHTSFLDTHNGAPPLIMQPAGWWVLLPNMTVQVQLGCFVSRHCEMYGVEIAQLLRPQRVPPCCHAGRACSAANPSRTMRLRSRLVYVEQT